MAWTPWDISDGQLSATPGSTIHSVTVTGFLGEMVLVNTSASAVTVNIYVDRTGASRRIIAKDLSIDAGGEVRRQFSIALLSGDIIKGDASTGAVVDYVFSGVKDV